ncbi:hypothetical protein [Deinococcus pimensis]|uniref:hypothetical protein n=1 Tax=Deinococcus pimensis TaxID=309888 RepID=UPI0004B1C412|nr:hypothetical protein [Deinococcus pimensis]
MRRHHQGVALVTTLGALALVAMLVGTALLLASSSQRRSWDAVRTTQAQAAAESGLEEAVARVRPESVPGSGTVPRSLTEYRHALDSFVREGAAVSTGGTLGPGTFSLRVHREDGPGRTTLTVTSEGRDASGTATRSLVQTLVVRAAPALPGDFAVLADVVACTFCHTRVERMDAPAGGVEGVKVGVLRALDLSETQPYGGADTTVVGTLHVRGALLNRRGHDEPLDAHDGLRLPASSGETANSDGAPVTRTCDGRGCRAGAAVYRHGAPRRGAVPALLPAALPPVVPDPDGDGRTDDAEWADHVARVSRAEGLGVLRATRLLLSRTPSWGPGAMPPAPVPGGTDVVTDARRGVPGHLVVSGDLDLSGTVLVDGDVLVSGRVRGTGRIVARGNVYVTGDLTYDCTRTSGFADCASVSPERLPRLVLASADGSVVVGDALGSSAHADRQAGERSSSVVPRILAEFNRLEWERASRDEGRPPTFYRLRERDPLLPVRRADSGRRHDVTELRIADVCPDGACVPGAATVAAGTRVLSLSPSGGWLADEAVKAVWDENMSRRRPTSPASDALPLRIDATLHARHAIVGHVHGCSTRECALTSPAGVVVRGALVARHVGLLVTGGTAPGLRVLLDPREDAAETGPLTLTRSPVTVPGDDPPREAP